MSEELDLERYIALIHSAPPSLLARLLNEILADPEDHLEHLRVFVPELCLVITRLLLQQDGRTAAEVWEALEVVLSAYPLDVERPDFLGARLEPALGLQLAYFLGRVQTLLVLCRRLFLLELPPSVRVEIEDGGPNQLLLKVLARGGAQSLRSLQTALRAEHESGSPISLTELRHIMASLVRADLVEAETRGNRTVLYRLSSLGRRLTVERPSWMEAVSRAYRAYRKDGSATSSPFARPLIEIFTEIDGEQSASASDPEAEATTGETDLG